MTKPKKQGREENRQRNVEVEDLYRFRLLSTPRGSQGYGQEFADSIHDDWGGIDYVDIMACVDYAISQSYIDNQRLGLAGVSYGGYMMTWIICLDQRFKAAVASPRSG